jgi:hypothetical protein
LADPRSLFSQWASKRQRVGAWIKLTWTSPVTFNQIVLYDRPNLADQVLDATLTFSDGKQVSTGALENDGSANYINISTVSTTSVVFKVTAVSGTTTSVGLSELQLYLVDSAEWASLSLSLSAGIFADSLLLSQFEGNDHCQYNDCSVIGQSQADHHCKKDVRPLSLLSAFRRSDSLSPSRTTRKTTIKTTTTAKPKTTAKNWRLIPTTAASRLRLAAAALNVKVASATHAPRHARDFTPVGEDLADQVLVKSSWELSAEGLFHDLEQ